MEGVPQDDEDLFLAGAHRDLLERAFRQNVSLLKRFPKAARKPQPERERCD